MQRIALYSHDAQGLGHLRRTLALAGGLGDAAASSILVATGVREVGLFPLPRGTDVLSLPRLKKDVDGQYSARSLDVSLRDIVRLRSAILRSALVGFRPDVLIVDHGPGGVAGELVPALASLRAAGTRLVLGLREVLDDPLRVQLEWARTGFADLVRRHYDAIWVYGDPRVHDP